MSAWEDAKETLRCIEEEYLSHLEDGDDEDDAMYLALGCAAGDAVAMLEVIWASGALDTAWEAAQEEIEQAVLHDVGGRTLVQGKQSCK